MATTRHLRLQERIMQETAMILRELKDPRIGMCSVVRAEVSPDGEFARIYVSTLATGEAAEAAMKVLKRAAGFVRTRLGEALGTRKVPEIRFRLDESMRHSQRIDEILREIGPGDLQP
jgi:ribosome-binding factor A